MAGVALKTTETRGLRACNQAVLTVAYLLGLRLMLGQDVYDKVKSQVSAENWWCGSVGRWRVVEFVQPSSFPK